MAHAIRPLMKVGLPRRSATNAAEAGASDDEMAANGRMGTHAHSMAGKGAEDGHWGSIEVNAERVCRADSAWLANWLKIFLNPATATRTAVKMI